MAGKIEIRGASGLGDAIYVYPVAKYYRDLGNQVIVRTKFPDVYKDLDVQTVKFFKIPKADITASYSNRKSQKTNQYQDVILNCKMPIDTPFLIDWKVDDEALVAKIKKMAKGRKILVISMPHQPFDRPDRYGDALRPNFENLQIAIDYLKQKNWFVIQIGKGGCFQNLSNIDLKKQNLTSVKGLMDICSIADGFAGQVGFIVPIAEAFNKPLFALFSKAGLRSSDKFIPAITGEKILSRDSSVYAIDSEPKERIHKVMSRVFK